MSSLARALDGRVSLEPARRRALERALQDAMRGEVRFDTATRSVYATDSSNYRLVPIGVVFPLDHADVVSAMRVCAEHDAPVLARGAGTSLAGQACNAGVVIDTSRHLTRIIDLDPDSRTARVQPGVVLDDLRRAAAPHGLTFGPDPATHAWCTVGGMIGNNACGSHALYAGKTSDNVESLKIVLYGGEVIEAGAYGEDAARRAATAAGGELGRVLGELAAIRDRYGELVRQRFPDIPRRVSGYNLDELLPERGFHVARALVGTESTCGVVTESKVRLSASPRHRRLVVLGYPDVFSAADAVPSLLCHPLLALEGFDKSLVDQMRERPLNVEHLPLLPDGGGWLIAELGAAEAAAADGLAEAFVADLPGHVAWRRYDDPERQARVWLVRESGLGATAITSQGGRNHEGWEDAAVPPAQLGSYLRAITGLWREFGYHGAWYGHFGQGCVHTRNNFDFTRPEGVRAFRAYVERAADLVLSLGGSISGEHGDGQARSELLGRMYGIELVEAFRAFKSVFDPRGRMNPGRIVDPYPLDADLRFGPGYRRSTAGPSRLVFGASGRSLQAAAERCVGVGACRREDAGTMCPSYRATRDERHSTRGRAKLLLEMFQGDVTPSTWKNEDVRAALDLCLSCKGCVTDCPTHVDMAAYKSEFLSHYFEGRLRPRSMYALGFLPWAARLASRMPWMANSVLSVPGLSWAVCRTLGLTTSRRLPRFARSSLRRSTAASRRLDDLDATVVVWPDTFTNSFRPQLAWDLIAILDRIGERVAIPSKWACCGRPLYDFGMLDRARRSLLNLVNVLDPWTARGVPVIVTEPSCLSAFRDELPALLSDDPRASRLASLARSPAEHFLASREFEAVLAATGRPERVVPAQRLVVHPHCQGRAIGTPASDHELLLRLGFRPEVLDAGCCGLAGSFGYREEHAPMARQIGEGHWLPRLRSAIEGDEHATLVIDGFSCEMQLQHLTDYQSTPLVTVVRAALGC